MMKNPLEHIINTLTIERCVICNTPGGVWCESCFLNGQTENESRCYICNKLTSQNRVCKSCKSGSRLRRVWWLGDYSGIRKELIWNMKYQRQRETARLFGRYLAEVVPYLSPDTIVTAIPTASSRIRRRGYDQAVLCAQAFAQKRELPYQTLLLRTDQKELIGKRRTERMKAMENSFSIKPKSYLKGVSILLIDDVLTTGASLESAAKILRKSGALHIDAAVIARRLLS